LQKGYDRKSAMITEKGAGRKRGRKTTEKRSKKKARDIVFHKDVLPLLSRIPTEEKVTSGKEKLYARE